MSFEKTLVIIKPDLATRVNQDAIFREILTRIERKGLNGNGKRFPAPIEIWRNHYIEHAKLDHYDDMCERMANKPVWVFIINGPHAIANMRVLIGKYDCSTPGTIRGDMGIDTQNNLIHGSADAASAAREVALWSDYIDNVILPAEKRANEAVIAAEKAANVPAPDNIAQPADLPSMEQPD
jgi:nucleoside-diphosphate kinase